MRVEMRRQMPEEAVKNFSEANLGYNEEEAIDEAGRCLLCKDAECVMACPLNVDIPAFIKKIKERKHDGALKKISEKNYMAGACSRVCSYEELCEQGCILKKKGKQIAISYLERFAADNAKARLQKAKPNGKKVAVVGSGPSGLTCAASLGLMGYKVTVFEGLHEAGGILLYGVPLFRLPREVLKEAVESIRSLGVEIAANTVVGRTLSIEEIEREYDAVYIATGASLPRFSGMQGENLNYVYSANEFLARINLMGAHKFPEYNTPVKAGKHVIVVGGNTKAVDAARAARRLGSAVTIVHKGSLDDMTARGEDIRHARDEGVKFMLLTSPVRILGSESIEGIECSQMMPGPEGDDGKKIPVRIENSEFVLACDTAVISKGEDPNPIIARTTEIMANAKGGIMTSKNMKTSREKVFAGGHIVSGDESMIRAFADGKRAAEMIDEFLGEGNKDLESK